MYRVFVRNWWKENPRLAAAAAAALGVGAVGTGALLRNR